MVLNLQILSLKKGFRKKSKNPFLCVIEFELKFCFGFVLESPESRLETRNSQLKYPFNPKTRSPNPEYQVREMNLKLQSSFKTNSDRPHVKLFPIRGSI